MVIATSTHKGAFTVGFFEMCCDLIGQLISPPLYLFSYTTTDRPPMTIGTARAWTNAPGADFARIMMKVAAIDEFLHIETVGNIKKKIMVRSSKHAFLFGEVHIQLHLYWGNTTTTVHPSCLPFAWRHKPVTRVAQLRPSLTLKNHPIDT